MSNASDQLTAIVVPMSSQDWLVLEDIFQNADEEAIDQLRSLILVEPQAEQPLLLKRYQKRSQAKG